MIANATGHTLTTDSPAIYSDEYYVGIYGLAGDSYLVFATECETCGESVYYYVLLADPDGALTELIAQSQNYIDLQDAIMKKVETKTDETLKDLIPEPDTGYVFLYLFSTVTEEVALESAGCACTHTTPTDPDYCECGECYWDGNAWDCGYAACGCTITGTADCECSDCTWNGTGWNCGYDGTADSCTCSDCSGSCACTHTVTCDTCGAQCTYDDGTGTWVCDSGCSCASEGTACGCDCGYGEDIVYTDPETGKAYVIAESNENYETFTGFGIEHDHSKCWLLGEDGNIVEMTVEINGHTYTYYFCTYCAENDTDGETAGGWVLVYKDGLILCLYL